MASDYCTLPACRQPDASTPLHHLSPSGLRRSFGIWHGQPVPIGGLRGRPNGPQLDDGIRVSSSRTLDTAQRHPKAISARRKRHRIVEKLKNLGTVLIPCKNYTLEQILDIANVVAGYSALALIPAGTGYMTWLLYWIAQDGRVRRSTLMIDDGTKSKDEFLHLLNEATRRMIVHVDGNKKGDSVYDSPEIVERVREKLAATPGLRILCLFDENERDLLFTRAAREVPQIEIKIRSQEDLQADPPLREHYQVIDGGRRAHLSYRSPSSPQRLYWTVDCSRVWKPGRSRVIQKDLGEVLARFDREYERAEMAA